ncbi:MAG TPA: peptidase T [Bacillota bacterium]|nr:peptidase T [Bacillota bacterium]HOK69051.1 peptidase T [Bacillota bacterium]HPP85828.1 peptidase T [Bacillota bacterium]
MNVKERFLKYVSFPTKSDEKSDTVPSTAAQLALGKYLAKEMKSIGMTDVCMDEYGYVYGTIKKNADIKTKIGFIAHMDTSPDFCGENIKPKEVVYNGGDIVLNDELGIVMTVKDFPQLEKYKGQRLIVTDGTTLLGADDKAGIAEIMTAAEELIQSGAPHGTIKVAFTPDEEIGRGADRFDVEGFGCDFAYTVDGGELGEIEYENFNAASLTVAVQGVNIHPGTAKNKMINSILIAYEYASLLPPAERPEHTEKYEGFFHLNEIEGNTEKTVMRYIIRDHDKEKFERRKQLAADAAEFINKKYGRKLITTEIKDTYYNMKEKILPHMEIIEQLSDAMRKNGVEPKVIPIRGGTDGAALSYKGLPCPNMCTGGENYHGKFEFVSVEAMEKIKDIIKTLMTSQK